MPRAFVVDQSFKFLTLLALSWARKNENLRERWETSANGVGTSAKETL